MKLLSPLTLLAASAAVSNGFAFPSNDNTLARLRQPQQSPMFGNVLESALTGGQIPFTTQDNKNEPPKYTKQEVRTAMELIDYNQFCGNTTNVTLHVPQGNISFREGYLVALPNVEPTVWTLKRDLNNRDGGYSISTKNQFGRTVYWQNSYDRVDVGTSDSSRFNIRIVPTTPDGKIVFESRNEYCIYFDKDGVARSNSNSACDSVGFRTVVAGVRAGETRWADPYPGFASCSKNVLNKYNNATNQTFDFDSLYSEDGDVEAQLGFLASIAVSVASYVITKVIDTVWP